MHRIKQQFIFLLATALFFVTATAAHAIWVYTGTDVPYIVGQENKLGADAGPDKYLVKPAAGLTVTGTATGSVDSSTWSYVGCKPSCPAAGVVVSPTAKNKKTHTTPVANMGAAAVGTVFTYKYAVTDGAGTNAEDEMDVIVVSSMTPDLTADYIGPRAASSGSITLTGSVINNSASKTSSGFTSYFEVEGDDTLSWTSPAVTLEAGEEKRVSVSRVFNPTTLTTYKVRLCADGANDVNESNENNNCSGWVSLLITPTTASSFTITATAGPNGTVLPAGVSTVSRDASKSYTITPAAGYSISSVFVDGTSIGTPSTYTFSKVNANHTISATFAGPGSGGGSGKCSDGLDNDGDGKIDYSGGPGGEPADPGCSSPSDNDEEDAKLRYIEH